MSATGTDGTAGDDLWYDVETQVWETPSFRSWAFVALPPDVSDEIDERAAALPARGFGAVRVEAAIGGSVWQTSVFPDVARGGYVMPLKKAIRVRARIEVGDTVQLAVRLLDV